MDSDNIVQIRNPRSGRYIKINREKGLIIGNKAGKLPYKNIPIFGRLTDRDKRILIQNGYKLFMKTSLDE